jgi:hypothetical protein
MTYSCCNENRKAAVLKCASLNGIDFLEVLDHDAIALNSPRQQTLLVYCLNPLTSILSPSASSPRGPVDEVLIQGGESITNIGIEWVSPASPPPPLASSAEQVYFSKLPNPANILVVRTDKAGDFSTYTLRLVNNASQALQDPFAVTEVLNGFDPQLAAVDFSFKVECGPNFDCQPQSPNCPPATTTPPPINYLAKDYGSFRTVMLDRLSQLLPNWNATSEADLGIALVELISFVGDRLSYQQDAIATEAYLETARSRVSLRRHALLMDYHVSDGSNARAWMQLQVAGNPGDQIVLDLTTTYFYTYAPGAPSDIANNQAAAILSGVQVFQPMFGANLYPEHNQISFYAWGDTNCCLPSGATEATLCGSFPNLQIGDVLIFQEMKGPQTGDSADADLRHRCAVRLTQVATKSANGSLLVDPLFADQNGNPITVTEIQWSQDDSLPFPVCISSEYLDSNGDEQTVTNVSAVFGNVVLADHGLSFSGSFGTVPAPTLFYPSNPGADRCQLSQPTPLPVRFQPQVPYSPLTQAVAVSTPPGATSPVTLANLDASLSADALMNFDPTQAVPAITLQGTLDAVTEKWEPVKDLLENNESDPAFVVEVESNGIATLRFGDDVNGKTPDQGTSFVASYRIGNGTAGNVGADSLVFLAAGDARIQSCRNPLPATGGTDPETNDQIRRRAPQAFLTQERSITMADYEAVAESNSQVDNAVASLRWTGSWYTVFIAVEPVGGGNLTTTLQKTLKQAEERYRLAGQDLELDSPQYLSLEIVLAVCVNPNYFQLDVEQSLLQVLGSAILPNGTKGLFYPDNFTFGQTVYLSPVYAAARSVAGVTSVTAITFQPQGVNTSQYLEAGEIELGPLQVARLDNDPNFPDHGQLTLQMQGGK